MHNVFLTLGIFKFLESNRSVKTNGTLFQGTLKCSGQFLS